MKKILIALDYDPPAQKIAETGYALAKAMTAKVVLVHILSEATYYFSPEYSAVMGFEGFNTLSMAPSVNSAELKKAGQDYLDKSKRHLGDDNIQTIIKEGDFASGIVETAKEVNADIIVLGSHGRRGFNKILMGSVAEQVLHKSTIPLFIIPIKDNQ